MITLPKSWKKNWNLPEVKAAERAGAACREWAKAHPWSPTMTWEEHQEWDRQRNAVWEQAIRESAHD